MGQAFSAIIGAAKSVADVIGGGGGGVQGAGAAAAHAGGGLPDLPGAAPAMPVPGPSEFAPQGMDAIYAPSPEATAPAAVGEGIAPPPPGVNAAAGVDAAGGPAVDNTLMDILTSIGNHPKKAPAEALAAALPQAAPVDPLAPLPEASASPLEQTAPPPSDSPLAQQAPPAAADTWKPHEENTLQKIGDFFLHGYFKNHNDERNMKEAFKGFQGNPDQAIARVAQFDPVSAYKMYAQRADDKRADATVDDTRNYKAEKVIGSVRSTAYNLANMADQTKAAALYPGFLQTAKATLARGHIPEEDFNLPDTYDQDQVSIIGAGGINPGKQASLAQGDRKETDTVAYRERTGDQKDRGLDIQEGNLTERSSHNRATEGQGAARIGETERHNNVTEGQGQNRIQMRNQAMRDKAYEAHTLIVKTTTKTADGKTIVKNERKPPGSQVLNKTGDKAFQNEGGKWVKYTKSSKNGKFYRLRPELQDGKGPE